MVTAIWGGNDEDLPIPGLNITGGVIMAKIWKAYNEAFYKANPTPPGAFPICDYKSALLKAAEQNKEENKGDNKVAQSKSATPNPGSMEAILNEPKVEEIDTSKEANDIPQTVIHESSMPPVAPPARPPIVEPITVPTPDVQPPTPALKATPQRLVPATGENGPVEQLPSAPASRRLYPAGQ